ncbi:MAG: hypothetical protein IJM47_00890 [Synergistaceae bacterium]|nr:hypothetical protein [Synergistaceae bacterium]
MERMTLLEGELYLTAYIVIGLIFAEIIMRLKIPDFLMKHVLPKNIPPVTALAVAVSAGSSKAGAAILSSALSNSEINERSAIWSVLMLSLPSYMRRWPSTFALSVSTAGRAGMIFALSMLEVAVMRFIIAFIFLKRGSGSVSSVTQGIKPSSHTMSIAKRLVKTLPLAWLFFALAYSLVPSINSFLKGTFAGNDTFLPLAGWTVAAASIGRVSVALALAGGSIAAGELSTAQAVFALVLGAGMGTVTRILRMNAGYYYGLFPKSTATKMLLANFATVIPLIMMNLLFAGLALSL